MAKRRHYQRHRRRKRRSPFGGVIHSQEEIRALSKTIQEREQAEFEAVDFDTLFDDTFEET